MVRKIINSEEDLCRCVIGWLENQHWDVYQEVSMGYASRRADIVAVMDPLVWVIEAKQALSLSLINQALSWRGYAHMISFVSLGGKRSPREVVHHICKSTGIGWMSVDKKYLEVKVNHEPRILRDARLVSHLRSKLCDEQKSFAHAGSREGGYWTPFAQTCREVLRRVKEKPGIKMKELMDGLEHHYSSDKTAKACLTKWIGDGVVKGVRADRDGKMFRLYPEDS